MEIGFKNILVAVDFDDRSEVLLSYASNLALKYDAQLWIVHIAAPEPQFVGYQVGPEYIRDVRAEDLRDEHRFLQKMAAQVREGGGKAEALLIQGPTVETLLEELNKLEADLLVVGSNQHGFLYRAFAEDTAAELQKQCQVPLLSIPLAR